jgi:NAD(P)-dependent dehydrogenase (short-subunit alcohol dehydrogenase family)
LSDALRVELAGFGVDVVLVEPGAVSTSFDERPRETRDTIRDKPAYGRLRRVIDTAQRFAERTADSPDRVAEVVLEAAESPAPNARYVVGVTHDSPSSRTDCCPRERPSGSTSDSAVSYRRRASSSPS